MLVLNTKNLFELPIYRINEDGYYQDLHEHIENINADLEIPVDSAYLKKNYGGDWNYNEIIGFLKFYCLGGRQIRCEYWQTNAKRKVRTRQKQFIMTSDSYCTRSFNPTSSNDHLKEIILDCVDHCQTLLGKKRFVDKSLFNQTFNHIDWPGLLA